MSHGKRFPARRACACVRGALLLAVATLLAGCAERPASPAATPSPSLPPLEPEEPLAFRTVLHTRDSPVFDLDLRTQLDVWRWNETWDAYATGLSPPWPAKPRLDFARETLVLVALGPKPPLFEEAMP